MITTIIIISLLVAIFGERTPIRCFAVIILVENLWFWSHV